MSDDPLLEFGCSFCGVFLASREGCTVFERDDVILCPACSDRPREKGNMSEKDPNGKNPHEPGAKLDAGKICAFRGAIDYFPRAIEQVAAVSTFGASKYAWKGWETVPEGVERYSDALVRHLIAAGKGEAEDPDSGLLHDAHTAWNALARLELRLREKENAVSVSG